MSKNNFRLKRILLPTDLSKESEFIFAHAIKLSLLAKAELDILYVGENANIDKFPQVLHLLERWRLLPPASNKADILKLGFFVRKIAAPSNDARSWIMDFLKTTRPDLIVLMTHQKKGITRWITKPISEPIARESKTMTLFMSERMLGIICLKTGQPKVTHVLIPITENPPPKIAIAAARNIAEGILQSDKVTFTLLYIGEKTEKPKVNVPNSKWETLVRNGNVVDEILKVAKFKRSSLIVMTTKGHNSFLDAIRGSTTEQVVRRSLIPVLAIPANQS